MKYYLSAIACSLCYLLLLAPTKVTAQLLVDSRVAKEQLVEMLVDKGVFYENVQLTCPEGAFGIFSHPQDQSNLSLGEGIILTTGLAQNAVGPNYGSNKSRSHGVKNREADLSKLSRSPKNMRDRCVLEFDVTPVGDQITFNYVFASEEYPEYVGSKFNDVFGFFVSGPGLNGKFSRNATNIAVVKKAKKWPVAVNTINSGKQTYKAPKKKKDKKDKKDKKGKKKLKERIGKVFRRTPNFKHLYTDNSKRVTNSIQYDGFTTTLEAEVRVRPCQKYHFKLAIADLGDGSMDSGVFIEKNSFKSNTYYAETALVEPCDTVCAGKVSLNILEGKAQDYSISWLFGNGPEKPGVLELDQLCPGSEFVAIVQPKKQACKQMIRVRVPEGLSIVGTPVASTSKNCNGRISLDVQGGVPPFTFKWSNGSTQQNLSGLCPGTYSVKVSCANDCSQELSFTVEDEVVVKIDTSTMTTRGNEKKETPKPAKEELEELFKENSKLLFEKGQIEVRPEDYIYLGKLSKILKGSPDLKIQIVGHASSEGSKTFNQAISLKRAEAVKKHLIGTGVPAEQLEVFAKGESELFQQEKSEADRKVNRRVEMKVVKK